MDTKSINEAIIALEFHGGRGDINDPRWEHGFLSSLRPYQGMVLIEKNFREVMNCLRVIRPLLTEEKIDKAIANDVAGIIYSGRLWAVHEDGMLRRNELVTVAEAAKIQTWLDMIAYAWMMLLETGDEALAFEDYDRLYRE